MTTAATDPIAHRAYIALGSNLGDRAANLQQAIARLTAVGGITVVAAAQPLQNPAVGGPVNSPDFLNTVVAVDTTLPADLLLSHLLKIELSMGRARHEKWGPRLIDLDLILYGDQAINQPQLKVPHPLMHQRRFVLVPLAQIAPQAWHPLMKKTAMQLLTDLEPR